MSDSKFSNFGICWSILTDVNIWTGKSPNDMNYMSRFKEHFEEAFEHPNSREYGRWWNRLHSRTDISEDDKMEIEDFEDEIHLICNIRDNLVKSGVLKDERVK